MESLALLGHMERRHVRYKMARKTGSRESLTNGQGQGGYPAVQDEFLLSFDNLITRRHVASPSKIIVIFFRTHPIIFYQECPITEHGYV
jgi:hypothetical protein